ncbi:MAG TPA: trehalose-phosphatase [Terriglobales bacterium]|nr:trehalose-phosphatase [Terriglobales bacterium]
MPHLEALDVFETTPHEVSDFFARVAHAPSRVLLLDYDGTLAPFSVDRHRAAPYPAIPALLDRIRNSTNTRLVVVTGRRAYEAAVLLGLRNIEVWGCHGLSRLHSDGTYELPYLDEAAVGQISEANRMLRQQGLFDLLEFKPGATAIHWRGMDSAATQVAQGVEKVWSRLRSHKGLQLLKFDGGMEIRVAGRNKSDVVRTVLAEMGSNSAAAYLGDDHTDEDAFEALRGHGLSVLVRHEYRPTIADAWIQPPDGVIAFLADWADACGGAS